MKMAATIAMLLEGLDLKIAQWEVDDNLLIPLVSGLVMIVLGILI